MNQSACMPVVPPTTELLQSPRMVVAKTASADQACAVMPEGIGTTKRRARPAAMAMAILSSFAPLGAVGAGGTEPAVAATARRPTDSL